MSRSYVVEEKTSTVDGTPVRVQRLVERPIREEDEQLLSVGCYVLTCIDIPQFSVMCEVLEITPDLVRLRRLSEDAFVVDKDARPEFVIEKSTLRSNGDIEIFRQTVEVPVSTELPLLEGTPLLVSSPDSLVPVLCRVLESTPTLVRLERCADQTIDPLTLLNEK
jgi:hypothetical protein